MSPYKLYVGNEHSPIKICDDNGNRHGLDSNPGERRLQFDFSQNESEDRKRRPNEINFGGNEERIAAEQFEMRGLEIAPCRRCVYYCRWVFQRCIRYPGYCWFSS